MRNLCLVLLVALYGLRAVAYTSETESHWYVTSPISSILIRVDKLTGVHDQLDICQTNTSMRICGTFGYISNISNTRIYFIDLKDFRCSGYVSYLSGGIEKTVVHKNRLYALGSNGRIQVFEKEDSIFSKHISHDETQWAKPVIHEDKVYFVALAENEGDSRTLYIVVMEDKPEPLTISCKRIEDKLTYSGAITFEIILNKAYIALGNSVFVVNLVSFETLTQFHGTGSFRLHPKGAWGYFIDHENHCIRLLDLETFKEKGSIKIPNLYRDSLRAVINVDYCLFLSHTEDKKADSLHIISLDQELQHTSIDLPWIVRKVYLHDGLVYISFDHGFAGVRTVQIARLDLQTMQLKTLKKGLNRVYDLYFCGRWMCYADSDSVYLYDLRRQVKTKKTIRDGMRFDVSFTDEGVYYKGKLMFHLKKKFDCVKALFVVPGTVPIIDALWDFGSDTPVGAKVEGLLKNHKPEVALEVLCKGLESNDPTARAFMYACLTYPYYGHTALTQSIGSIREELASFFKIGSDPKYIAYYEDFFKIMDMNHNAPWVEMYF